MGLDLEPLGRAKAGHEKEWLELMDLIYEGEELSQPQIDRRYAITIQPFEDIGAPRVGSDEEANRWAIKLARSNGHPGSDAEIVEELNGHSAVTLMIGRCDGVAEFSAGHTMNHVDGTSFRGQILENCGDVLDEETVTQAWQQVFRPEEAIEYGECNDLPVLHSRSSPIDRNSDIRLVGVHNGGTVTRGGNGNS